MLLKTILKWFIPSKRNHYQPYALRKKALTFYVTVLFGLKVSVGFLMFAFPQPAFYASITAEEILRLTNIERNRVDVESLTLNSLLNQSALLKTNDMFENQYFAHVSPQGIDPWHWFNQVGYHYTYAGENLAIGFQTTEGMHQAWMNSAGHRDNILSPNFKEMGIAIVFGQFEGEYTSLITVHLGSTENTPPEETPEYLPEEPEPVVEETPPPPPVEEEEPEEEAPLEPTPDLTPPALPKFIEPQNFIITNQNQPTLTGIAEAGAKVVLYQGDNPINETKANQNSRFSFTIAHPLKDGAHAFRAAAIDEAGNWSAFSPDFVITIDTEPPNINLDRSYAIPSYLKPRETFDVFAYVSGDPVEVRAVSGNIDVLLEKQEENIYTGIVDQTSAGIWIKAVDQAGNISNLQLTTIKELKITPPPSRQISVKTDNSWALFVETLDQAITKMIVIFMASIFFLLLVNVLVHIRKQNQNMIFSIVFVLCLSALLLLV